MLLFSGAQDGGCSQNSWRGKMSHSRRFPPAQDPKTPSLQNLAGFIPSLPAGVERGWGVAGAEPWARCVGTAGGPERADGAAEAGAGRPSGGAGAGAALAQPRQAGTGGWGGSTSPGPIKPCHRVTDLPPVLGQRFSSSPRSCHRAEHGPSPAVSQAGHVQSSPLSVCRAASSDGGVTRCPGPPWQAGVELSAQVDALHAEKEVLRRSVSEKECELLSTRGLIEEKELQLSQEADKATREIRELQGRLLEKVQC